MSNYPFIGINGHYYSREFLESVWEYLQKQAPIWEAGITEPSPADKLAYEIMKQISLTPKSDNVPI